MRVLPQVSKCTLSNAPLSPCNLCKYARGGCRAQASSQDERTEIRDHVPSASNPRTAFRCSLFHGNPRVRPLGSSCQSSRRRFARRSYPRRDPGYPHLSFADLSGIIFGIRTTAEAKRKILRIIAEKCKAESPIDFEFHQMQYSRRDRSFRIAPLKLIRLQ